VAGNASGSAAEFGAALTSLNPDDVIKIGGPSEAQYQRRYAAALGLLGVQAEQSMFADLFDAIIYSREVGLVKLDRRIYVLLCGHLGVAPSEVVFVDDVPETSMPPLRSASMGCSDMVAAWHHRIFRGGVTALDLSGLGHDVLALRCRQIPGPAGSP